MKLVSAFVAGILTVIVIALLIPSFVSLDPGTRRTDSDLRAVGQALRFFQYESERFPTLEEGIDALVHEGFLASRPVDPWGVPYRYTTIEGLGYSCALIWTFGGDNSPGGGTDKDEDLSEMVCRAVDSLPNDAS